MARKKKMMPLDWMRLGARAMRLACAANCGNFQESGMEDVMTGGLSKMDKRLVNAQVDAAAYLDKEMMSEVEDSALGYASYMGSEADRELLAAQGVNGDWLYRRENGVLSRKEKYELSQKDSTNA